jgi:hypothetical protein
VIFGGSTNFDYDELGVQQKIITKIACQFVPAAGRRECSRRNEGK